MGLTVTRKEEEAKVWRKGNKIWICLKINLKTIFIVLESQYLQGRMLLDAFLILGGNLFSNYTLYRLNCITCVLFLEDWWANPASSNIYNFAFPIIPEIYSKVLEIQVLPSVFTGLELSNSRHWNSAERTLLVSVRQNT